MYHYYFFISFYCETPTYKGFKAFTYYTGESFPSLVALRRYAEERLSATMLAFVPLTIQSLTKEQYDNYGDN